MYKIKPLGNLGNNFVSVDQIERLNDCERLKDCTLDRK